MNMVIAKPLTPGSTIGLIAPAGPVFDPQQVQNGIDILKDGGYRVKVTTSLEKQDHYLSGTDQERTEQLVSVWQDDEIDGIIAVRGGYGCLRVLPFLNMDIISRNPKLLIGFSDISVLLNIISQEADLVTYHGPMLNTLSRCDRDSRDSFFAMLEDRTESYEIPEINILKSGNASGQLIGGNLASLTHLIGTPYDFPWDGAILFIEDTGEALYRIDRLLTHLHAAGKLTNLSGLILGTFTDTNGNEEKWTDRVWQRIQELAGDHYPIWANFPCGHGGRNLTLPVGRVAAMDSNSKSLRFI